jgi:hypothetical protein
MILMLGATGSCLIGVIMAICSQQRQSRCSKISCCCGLFSCERDIMSDDLAKAQMEADEHNKPPVSAPPPDPSKKYEDV